MRFVNGKTKVGSLSIARGIRKAFDVLFALTGGIRGINPQNVPAEGGVIIAPNHVSDLDSPALACTMRHRRLLAMGKEELWKNKAFGWLIEQVGAHPVRRGEGDTESIRWCLEQLAAGHTLLVFPEGTRGDGRTLLPIARGVALLAKKSGAPVVPVAIIGTEQILPPHAKRLGRAKITVVYGELLRYTDFADRETFLTTLEARIIALNRAHGREIQPSAPG